MEEIKAVAKEHGKQIKTKSVVVDFSKISTLADYNTKIGD